MLALSRQVHFSGIVLYKFLLSDSLYYLQIKNTWFTIVLISSITRLLKDIIHINKNETAFWDIYCKKKSDYKKQLPATIYDNDVTSDLYCGLSVVHFPFEIFPIIRDCYIFPAFRL